MVQNIERNIRLEENIPANISQTYKAWTTKEGLESFFAPQCEIELKPYGKFEIFFDPSAPEGKRGSENCRDLAFQENKFLSFTWSAPPSIPKIREFKTTVVVRFVLMKEKSTKIILTHYGWGEGVDWDEAFNYFTFAWSKIVLPRLKYRFNHCPVDWTNPPRLDA